MRVECCTLSSLVNGTLNSVSLYSEYSEAAMKAVSIVEVFSGNLGTVSNQLFDTASEPDLEEHTPVDFLLRLGRMFGGFCKKPAPTVRTARLPGRTEPVSDWSASDSAIDFSGTRFPGSLPWFCFCRYWVCSWNSVITVRRKESRNCWCCKESSSNQICNLDSAPSIAFPVAHGAIAITSSCATCVPSDPPRPPRAPPPS
mmetsp:Transcript_62789/g.132604  ORF Transcript_62789/g.132604 Transcript_62789/m.132604 type:complete len:200 (+) Transcript_62789:1931-2530(+)